MAKIHAVNGEADKLSKMELLTRTTLETHKLDLMAEISNLKLRLATSEKQRLELHEKWDKSQKRVEDMQSKLQERTMEIADLRTKVGKNGTIPAGSETDWQIKTLDREKTLDRLKRKHNEVERLKKAVESLMIAHEEKDRCIEDLRRNMKRYKKMEDGYVVNARRDEFDDPSDHSSTPTSSPSANDTVKEMKQSDRFQRKENGHYFHYNTAPARPNNMPHPTATSTPVNSYSESPANHNYSPPSTINVHSPKSHMLTRSNSCDEIPNLPHKTPTSSKNHGNGGYGTLPNMNLNRVDLKDKPNEMPPPPSSRKNKVRTDGTTDEESSSDFMAQQYKALTSRNYDQQPKKKSKGIKRFFGKLRRSNSQDFDNDGMGDFKRNGLRSTAGPRLGWSKDVVNSSSLDVPFARWDGDRVAVWMHSIGLSMYVGGCKRWVKNGGQLLTASSHELEKELNMRIPLHRKKLQLALKTVTSEAKPTKVDELDHNWVARWLDDAGLPQYKDHFTEARVDGKMLHFLTVDDLLALKVSNELHHISIKRGIQVLRMNQFDPMCLKRRPAPDEGQLQSAPAEVMLWTNHRVMEWLRTIDLSEYAPNLRGSGVHGALMVLEPRFTSETFASILSIPHSKTLLRRHLTTHFVALLGNDTQAAKRDYENSNHYIPLTPNAKVKATKRIFHKRSKSDVDFICPMDLQETSVPFGNSSRSPTLSREEKENMLSKAQFDKVPTSNV